MSEQLIVLVRKDCGIHFGHQSGPCAKCEHHKQQMDNATFRAGLQYSGAPMSAIFEEPQHGW